MHANKREEIKEVYAGDIAAAVGLRSVTTGDTICDEKHPILLESMDFPEPVITLAIEPKTKADQEKLGQGLAKLQAEDPTFRVRTDHETGQVVIGGMGELHLEIIVDRLKREFSVEASVGRPQVAYKETLTQPAQGEGRYIRQTGGRGQYGHAKIRLEPRKPGEGFAFENEIVGGSIPREYIKPIEEGIREAMTAGVLAELPGRRREASSSTTARTTRSTRRRWRSRLPARWRSRTPRRSAGPVLLEPVMRVEVVVPEEYMGDIMGDLNSRRGRITAMEARGGTQIVRAACPCRRCSATRRTCGRARRAARPTRCTLIGTSRRPRT